jgi:hypothetical protein
VDALAARAPVRFESVAVAKSAVTPLSAVEAKENWRIATDLAKLIAY